MRATSTAAAGRPADEETPPSSGASAVAMDAPVQGHRGPMGPLRRFLRHHWYAWALTSPVIIVMGVLIGFPFLRGLYLSVTNATEQNIGRTIGENEIPATYEFVGAANYLEILAGDIGNFWPRLVWTVVWTVVCVAAHFGIGLALAILLNRHIRLRGLYRVLMIVPWALPPFVSAFIWRYLLNGQYGVFNAALTNLGLPAVPWLNDPTIAKVSVILVNVWLGVPFMMLALLGGLQSISRELYEAARVDGASPWQQFRHITLPGLSAVAAPVVLIGTIWTFNQFPVIFLVSGGGPGDSTELLVTYAFRLAFEGIGDYGASSAYGMLILGLLLVMAVIYQRALKRGGQAW
ncbi:sugar ABC transporter permease [Lipingzhangella sp. LS1_29]|uniref:Sugar ABC transporter permease n=1 Tax=Lipingzhangella rawalii TaxID=2055835 RepID=A0ABU2H1W9_9ACTN|nr:sugar ABC transporter permease [Lipingzhangella rawalii]MDS1269291.1 sugar ABC transporter permease [Lipingzhangella rawalii]